MEGAGPRAQSEAAPSSSGCMSQTLSGEVEVEDWELSDADSAGQEPFPKRARFYFFQHVHA